MNIIKNIILILSLILPSSFRIILLNIFGFKINRKAKLKIFSLILAKDIQIGAFAKIDNFVVITGLQKLIMKEYSAIQRFTYISGNHVFKVEKRSMVGSRCIINAGAGDVEIGEYSAFAPRSSIYTHGTFLPVTLGYSTSNKGVKIGDYCWVMQNSSISPGVIIESNTIILPGSIVIKNVSGNSVVFDTPTQRKSFPIYFFRKNIDDTELVNLIKEITINFLTELKTKTIKMDFVIEGNSIIVNSHNAVYKIYFSEVIPDYLNSEKDKNRIHFYFNIDSEIMRTRKFVFYDFKNITKSYDLLPKFLSNFDDYAFSNFGLKFIDIKYFKK